MPKLAKQLAKQFYDEKRTKTLAGWIARATAHVDTPKIRAEALKKFNLNYPKFNYKEGDKIHR